MNTLRNTHNRVGLGALLALVLGMLAPLGYAGAGPQYWRDLGQIKTQTQAKEIEPNATVMLVCGACKTVKLTEYKSGQTNGRPPMTWMEVGSKHECEHCGGTITVKEGKTKDEMQHNCSKCGEGAAFCCAEMPQADKK